MDHDFLTIVWPPITFPVGTSPWMSGDAAKRPTHITVTPTLQCWFQDFGTADSLLWRDFDLAFEAEDWDTDTYGLVYGDESFEQAVAAWFATLGFPEAFGTPFFTEAGMQSGEHISMQLATHENAPWWEAWGSMHAALAWLAKGTGGTPTSVVFQPEPAQVAA